MLDMKAACETALGLLESGQREAALTHFETCLRDALDRDDATWIPILATNAAFVCQELERWEAAISYYSLALKHKDERHLHLAVSNVYEKIGDMEKARSHLERCLHLAAAAGDQSMLKTVQERLMRHGR